MSEGVSAIVTFIGKIFDLFKVFTSTDRTFSGFFFNLVSHDCSSLSPSGFKSKSQSLRYASSNQL
jgi:hypothetical protein